MHFEFATATRIVFGAGTLREAGPLARESGRRALVVTGREPQRSRALTDLLAGHGIDFLLFAVSGEPEIATIESGVQQAKTHRCELVISFGGGSALDAGKAIAAMLANPGELLDYLEVIGRGQALARPVRSVYRHPDHGRHRLGGHAQRGIGLA